MKQTILAFIVLTLGLTTAQKINNVTKYDDDSDTYTQFLAKFGIIYLYIVLMCVVVFILDKIWKKYGPKRKNKNYPPDSNEKFQKVIFITGL